MEEDYKSDYRLIDPRKVEIDDTTTNFYNSALRECGFKIPLYVAIYNQIRYFEDFGKLKIGYSVQSKEAFAEQFGVSVKQIEKAFDHLTNRHKLGNWIICDTKIFRNVTKIWVSNVRQKRGTMDEAVRLLQSASRQDELPSLGSKTDELPSLGSKTPQLGEQNSPAWGVATPELTGAESNIKINKRESVIADSANASSALSPFFSSVSKKDKQEGRDSLASNRKLYAFCADLLTLMGLSHVKAGVKLKSAVQARMKEGYSELDLRAVARWSATQSDGFWKVPHSLFSEAGVATAIASMKKEKRGTTYSTR